jgi:hypothetical protein
VIVNLSSKPLNSSESSLLSKGLHFCPNPPKINVRELDEDLTGKIDNHVRFSILCFRFLSETSCTCLPHHYVLGGINGSFGFDSKGLKIKETPQTPGIKTNNFSRRWDRILFYY